MTQNIIQMNTQPAKNLNIEIKMEKDKEEKMHIDQNNGKRVHRKKRRRRKRKEKKSTQDISQRFVVKKWSAVALWCYDVIQTECGICRNSLIELCTECQLNHDSETCSECSTVIGACNHAFHFHCISMWTKEHSSCPYCTRDWEIVKITD